MTYRLFRIVVDDYVVDYNFFMEVFLLWMKIIVIC